MSGFLPNDYKVPAGASVYMKMQDGSNKVRILAAPVLGFVVFPADSPENKFLRFKMDQLAEVPESVDPDKVKHFWCVPVYNYATKSIEMWEIVQKKIMKQIQALVENEDWGNPTEYDITVVKSGKAQSSEYSIQPSPMKPLPDEAVKKISEVVINTENIFTGEKPIQSARFAAQQPAATEEDGDSSKKSRRGGY